MARGLAAAVCDTHALLFHAARDRRLGRLAAAAFARCEAREALMYVPAAVIWEIALLARRGRIDLGRPLASFCDDLFSNPAFQSFDLGVEQVLLATEYPPNADPFDGLIVAAARLLDLPLITRDRDIVASAVVPTVW
jgi:PIN domain nuclease of toxin-antitoxin system